MTRRGPGGLMGSRTLVSAALVLILLGGIRSETAGGAQPPADAAGRRPNIVVILADDLGYGDVGVYNAASKIPTPNIDRLAKEGTRFTDAHAPASVCTPTRYAMLTGRYAWRGKLKRQVLGPFDPPLIEKDRLTVPELLRRNGYYTACFGKWHLGWTWATVDGKRPATNPARLSNVDFTKQVLDGPTTRGFDYFFGVDVPNYPPYCFIENDKTIGVPTLPDEGRPAGYNRAGPMLEGWKLVNVLPDLTKQTVKHIETVLAKREKPFFLYLPLTSPHHPVLPAAEFKGKSGAGDYGDFVVQTDWVVGQVMEALEKNGLAENTLVIFTSDNGPETTGEVRPAIYERARRFEHESMGVLRGAKRDLWEGGHRVPFIARWPGKVKTGVVSDETICQVDLMATFASMLKVEVPKGAGEDSVNILPALLRERYEGRLRETTVHHSASGQFGLRQGDWVLIDAPSGDDNGPRLGEPEWLKESRGYVKHDHAGELYNLKEDLGQRKNLYAEHPERVKKMKGLLDEIKKRPEAGTKR